MTTFAESFCAAEREAFGFLIREHGFLALERKVTRPNAVDGVVARVVYESAPAEQRPMRAVALTVAPLRLELDLRISRATSGSYSIEELHALDGKGFFPRREHGLYDAMHEPALLLAEFLRLAGVLRACGGRFFDDESILWKDLAAQRGRQADNEEVKRTLALAQTAFGARDWTRVVELLTPIEARLGRTATARLAYSQRKVRDGG